MKIKHIFDLSKKKSLRDITVEAVECDLFNYATEYARRGMYLPPEFAQDPMTWTLHLAKMKRAFKLLSDENQKEGALWEAKNKWNEWGEKDESAITEIEKEVQEGLALFGKYLYWLTDTSLL